MTALSRPSVDINYPQERWNVNKEIETSLKQGKTLIDLFREREERALEMCDNEALDARKMTDQEMEAQEEWVDESKREEAEDAYALDNADDIEGQTLNPEELLIRKQALLAR